jgi:hypothetical protein
MAGRLRRGLRSSGAPLQRLICPAFKFLVISPSKSGRILLCFSAPRRWRSSTLLYQSFIHCSSSRIFSLAPHLRRIFLSFFQGGEMLTCFALNCEISYLLVVGLTCAHLWNAHQLTI